MSCHHFLFSATVYASRPSLSSLDSNPSRTKRASHVALQISARSSSFFPVTNYILPKDYCLIGMVNPVFTKFLIYLTYIISGMVLIYSSKKANLGVFFPSFQKNKKKAYRRHNNMASIQKHIYQRQGYPSTSYQSRPEIHKGQTPIRRISDEAQTCAIAGY